MYKKAELGAYIESANYIKAKNGGTADVAVILGSGLGVFADTVTDKIVIPYADIPNFPRSTVSYQRGELVCGTVEGRRVLVMNGRFHYYEGYEMWETAYPVGVFKLLGVCKLIITNAAGGISDKYRLGDLVSVRDHIKLTADSPCRGANISEFGDRFFDMQRVYDMGLNMLAQRKARELGIELKEGIYGFMSGPQYETPAEINMLRTMGATLVGMSTVAEVILAAQCRIPVLCLSCVTNMAAGITGTSITEKEVLETGKVISQKFRTLLSSVIGSL